jgi:hypothetical protein
MRCLYGHETDVMPCRCGTNVTRGENFTLGCLPRSDKEFEEVLIELLDLVTGPIGDEVTHRAHIKIAKMFMKTLELRRLNETTV